MTEFEKQICTASLLQIRQSCYRNLQYVKTCY